MLTIRRQRDGTWLVLLDGKPIEGVEVIDIDETTIEAIEQQILTRVLCG
jgi:hypothetical protein